MNQFENFINQATVIDTETTHVDIEKAELVELATGRLLDNTWQVINLMYGTNNPIPPEASAVHNISNRMVKGLPRFDQNTEESMEIMFLGNTEWFVAHNSNFDKAVLEKHFSQAMIYQHFKRFSYQSRWICTFRLAKHFLSNDLDDISSYSLSYLRYYLDLDVDPDLPAHRADADVTTCGKLLEFLIDYGVNTDRIDPGMPIGPQLTDICWSPIPITVWGFGKHKGQKLSEIPSSYFMWCLTNFDSLDPNSQSYDIDLATSVERELVSRGEL